MSPPPSTADADLHADLHADLQWMRRAVELALRGDKRTRPNPRVGCVLVRDGTAVGEGFHEYAGGLHAEVIALQGAADRAAGATAYVTLEPCNHHGKTGPCTDALLKAGVVRVVCGKRDPNPTAAGGLEHLEDAGVATRHGVLADECERAAEVFFANVRHKRPFVRIKLAATLDGRTAAADGTSRWITGPIARRKVHELRADADAVLVGSGTIIADDPELNVRHVDCAQQPVRIVLDRRLRVTPSFRIAQTANQATWLCTTTAMAKRAETLWSKTGVEVLAIDDGAQAWLSAVLRELSARGIHALFCEAGAQLAGALVRSQNVDRLDMMLGAKLLGDGAPVLQGIGANTIGDAVTLRIDHISLLGDDAWLSAKPVWGA